MRVRVLVCVFCLLSLSGCATPAPPEMPAGLSASEYEAIRGMTARFRDLVVAKDWASLKALFADNAVLMPPGAGLVAGAAAISEWFASAGGTLHEFTTSVDAIGGSGNLAVNRGKYNLVMTPPSATERITEPGKFLWVLQRQPDKSWRITAATWNADVAK